MIAKINVYFSQKETTLSPTIISRNDYLGLHSDKIFKFFTIYYIKDRLRQILYSKCSVECIVFTMTCFIFYLLSIRDTKIDTIID